jgi:hypothetical protein
VGELLRQLQKAEELRDRNPEDVPVTSRAGYEIVREQSRTDAVALRARVESATIPRRLVGLAADGDPDALVAVDVFLRANGGIAVEVDSIYQEIAEACEPTYGREREFGANCYLKLLEGVSRATEEMGWRLPRNNYPEYRANHIVPTFTAAVAFVRDSVRSSPIGDELVVRMVRKSIVDQTFQRGLTDSKVPVILLGVSEVEHTSLAPLFSRYGRHTFEAGYEPDDKSLTAILRQVNTNKSKEENKENE